MIELAPKTSATSADDPRTELPSPAAALESTFRSIAQQQMQGVPILNPALTVEAVGFRHWNEHWLGVLITPWFMNLWLMPRLSAKWPTITAGASRHHVFPAGVFEFLGGHETTLGDYQACSLFSPMFDFADHAAAHATAVAALDALFDAANRELGEVHASPQSAAAAPEHALPAARAVSKRDFLFGLPPRAERGP